MTRITKELVTEIKQAQINTGAHLEKIVKERLPDVSIAEYDLISHGVFHGTNTLGWRSRMQELQQ